MSGDLGNSMELPYEPEPTGRTSLADPDDAQICGGLVVMGAVAPVPELGEKPALVFRFSRYDGRMLPPIVLVADPGQMTQLALLVGTAVAAAVKAAAR